jgi:hypothetical protein
MVPALKRANQPADVEAAATDFDPVGRFRKIARRSSTSKQVAGAEGFEPLALGFGV